MGTRRSSVRDRARPAGGSGPPTSAARQPAPLWLVPARHALGHHEQAAAWAEGGGEDLLDGHRLRPGGRRHEVIELRRPTANASPQTGANQQRGRSRDVAGRRWRRAAASDGRSYHVTLLLLKNTEHNLLTSCRMAQNPTNLFSANTSCTMLSR